MKINNSIYRKKTHLDKYLQFDSHHQMAHKQAVVKTLFNRAIRICSSLCEKKNVYLLLNVIKRYSKTTSKKQMEKDRVEVTVVIPYVKICPSL